MAYVIPTIKNLETFRRQLNAALADIHTNLGSKVNLAPNSQWEIWSAVNYGTCQNVLGTGTVGTIAASANTTGTLGSTTFTVTTTGELKIGDLLTAAGGGVDAALLISPMRVTALVPNSLITVRVPFGKTPAATAPSTLTPVVIGNQSAIGTGDGPDGWKKTTSLPIWRENNPANVTAHAYYALGASKDSAGAEQIYTVAPNVSQFAGKTVTFGIYGYQKVQGGAGTWQLYFNDSVNGVTLGPALPTTTGYQWAECTLNVPLNTTSFYVGVQLNGNSGDAYYFENPMLVIGGYIGGVQNYAKPREILTPTVHISPFGWVNGGFSFPTSGADAGTLGYFVFHMDPYAESGGQIAPTVVRAKGQLEGINPGVVQVGTGIVRVMAWFDRNTAPEKSGSFLTQYVQNVKSFSYMDFPFNQTDAMLDVRGTGCFQSCISGDTWSNVSLEFDEFILQ